MLIKSGEILKISFDMHDDFDVAFVLAWKMLIQKEKWNQYYIGNIKKINTK